MKIINITVKMPNCVTVGKMNKNKCIITEECINSIINQVSEAYKNNSPIAITNEYQPTATMMIDPTKIMGYVKEYSTDEVKCLINKNVIESFNKLIDQDYKIGYRMMVDHINDDRIIRNPKIISFDMIKVSDMA